MTYERVQRLLAENQPIFAALGDVVRQDILLLLACEERLSVGELAMRTSLARPTVSHHLKILREAGLLTETKEGVKRYYHPSFRAGVQSFQELCSELVQIKEMM